MKKNLRHKPVNIRTGKDSLHPYPSIKSIKIDTFNKPRFNLGTIPSSQIFEFLLELGLSDGDRFICNSETGLLGQVIRWRGTYCERTQSLVVEELAGRCTKGQVHQNGAEWITKNCLGRFTIKFEGGK